MLNQIAEAQQYILEHSDHFKPQIGIILGTGLGGLIHEMEIMYSLPYHDIPHFPVSTVESHSGKLMLGKLGGKSVIVMQGRFHYYEGYDMSQVVFPVRVMKYLGIKHLLISNASGGMNPDFRVGDLMIIRDHINLFPSNPLLGKNFTELGPRFPDMSEAYNKDLISLAKKVGQGLNLNLKEGVYVGLSGPCFETPAEYRFLRIIGGDAVGMSTVPEVIAARHMNLSCFALSVITDLGLEGQIEKITLEEVIAAASKAEVKMTAIIKGMLSEINLQ